jgi:hypothetical protein
VDGVIAEDMAAVVRLIGNVHRYPDSLGYGAEFEKIVELWRPELTETQMALKRD